jgi:hypothetical protein
MNQQHIEIIKRALNIARTKARARILFCEDKILVAITEQEIAEYDEVLNNLETEVVIND